MERDPSTNLAALTLRAPVRRDGQFLGALVSTISIVDLSRLLAEINLAKQERAFLLYGREFVLAHPANVLGVPLTKDGDALPRVADFGDPVLTALWDDHKSRLVERRGTAEARLVEAPGGQRLVLFQPFQEFGPVPWIVGGQFLVEGFRAGNSSAWTRCSMPGWRCWASRWGSPRCSAGASRGRSAAWPNPPSASAAST